MATSIVNSTKNKNSCNFYNYTGSTDYDIYCQTGNDRMIMNNEMKGYHKSEFDFMNWEKH